MGLFFSKCSYSRLQSFISPSFKYSINLIFSAVVCICRFHIFNGVIPFEIIQNIWIMSPLSHRFFSKLLPVVGIIEIWKPWKYKPLTPSISGFIILSINGKLMCLDYFFFNNFCFKQPMVLKFTGVCFWLKKVKQDIEIALNMLVLSYRKILSKLTIHHISAKEKDMAL